MKKLVAVFLCMLLVVSSTMVAFAAISPDDQMSMQEANTRTEAIPRDANGALQFSVSGNTVTFNDESTDGTISRVAFSTTNGDHDWTLNEMYWSGLNGNFAFRPWNTTTPASAGCFLQWDLGMVTHLDAIELWYYNTASTSNLDAIPLNIKFEYSDDGITWSTLNAAEYDLTDVETIKSYYDDATAQAKVDAYAAWLEGTSTDEQNALLANTMVYPLNFNCRYFRYYPLANGQQNYMDRGETYIRIKYNQLYDYSAPWDGLGNGTEEDPFIIESIADLNSLVSFSASGVGYKNKYFRLDADIDLSDADWTPIAAFGGTFDGNNHVIKNLHIGSADSMVTNSYLGFIQHNTGTVMNLGFEDAAIYCGGQTSGDPRMGTIAAQNSGAIKNCYVENTYLYMAPTGVGGGIVGDNLSGGVICNSYVAGTNYIMNSRPGGIIGDHYSGAVIENCYASGYTYIGSAGSGYNTGKHGGLIGESNGTITNCYTWVEETNIEGGTTVNATAVTKAALTDGTLAAALGSAYVQGFEYPILARFAETDAVIKEASAGDEAYTVSYIAILAQADADAKVIIALYNGDEMVAVKTVSASELSATLVAANADYAKLYIVNSLTNLKPLVVNAEYEIN